VLARRFVVPTVAMLAAGCSESAEAVGPGYAQFRGLYVATPSAAPPANAVHAIAIENDGTYVLLTEGCGDDACLDIGTASLDASGTVLRLSNARTGVERRLLVEVLTTTARSASSETILTPQDVTTLVGDGPQRLVDGNEQAIQAAKVDGETLVLDGKPATITELTNGRQVNPPWPGKIAGVGPLLSSSCPSVPTVPQPFGNAVTVGMPNSAAFAGDDKVAAYYANAANLYNSHGIPGMLLCGIPEDQVKRLLNDSSKPLIVAACFSGALLEGGSTIRRLVSSYADDPLTTAKRVYGCTGETSTLLFRIPQPTNEVACTGVWVDANGHAVPLLERRRLGLEQGNCTTTIPQFLLTEKDCRPNN
jgi:hypothetical protein